MNVRLGLTNVFVATLLMQACTGAISGTVSPGGSGGVLGAVGTGGGSSSVGSGGSAAIATGGIGVMAGTGGAGAGAGGGTGTGGTGAVSTAPAATPTVMRLSTVQWANTIRDLFQLANPGPLETALTPDAVVRFDNEADSLFVGETLRVDIQTVAERLAAQVVADPAALARLVPVSAPTDAVGKAKAYITDFGRRAYRRPLTATEVQDYLTLFNQAPTLTSGMTAFPAGVRVTLEAFLQSPYFLYRTALGGAAVQKRARLTDYEIATNLSYALTNTMPDTTLSAVADAGGLQTAAAIVAQAKRLMPTTLGKAAVDRFYFQYFGLGQYDTLQKNPTLAPSFVKVGPTLHTEAQQFLQYLFLQNGTLRDIFNSPVGLVNSTVASLYGLTGTFSATTWTQVNFDPAQRPGLLTRLGFLTYYANDGLQDSIHRGANINQRILCHQMSAPTGIVIAPLPPQVPTETNRQLVEGHTGVGTCGAACHATFINPAGFAFENFDGFGKYQTMEKGQPVNVSGSFPFSDGTKTFTTVAEFTKALGDSAQTHSCYAKTWAANLYSRIPRLGDEAAAATAAQRSLSQNISTLDLIVALVTDDAFVTRVEGP